MIDWRSIHDIAEEILYNNDADDDDNADADDADKDTTRSCDSNTKSDEVDQRTMTRRLFDNTTTTGTAIQAVANNTASKTVHTVIPELPSAVYIHEKIAPPFFSAPALVVNGMMSDKQLLQITKDRVPGRNNHGNLKPKRYRNENYRIQQPRARRVSP